MNKWAIVFLFLIAGTGCQDKSEDKHETFALSQQIDIQGHRGCRGLMPENSIAGFMKALDIGVTTLELDVVMSRDSQVLVSHEPWLSSVICKSPTGEDIAEGSERDWNLYQMNYDEIAVCDCGQRRHPRFPDQQLSFSAKPLLSEVIDTVEAYLAANKLPPVSYNIETKSVPSRDGIFHPKPTEFVQHLLEVIREKNVEDRVLIQSFDPRTLQETRKLDPDFRLVLLVEGEMPGEERLEELGFIPDVYSPEFVLVTDSLRKWTEEKGMKLIPWTVNEPVDMKRLIALGVDGIITDYPDRLVQVLQVH